MFEELGKYLLKNKPKLSGYLMSPFIYNDLIYCINNGNNLANELEENGYRVKK